MMTWLIAVAAAAVALWPTRGQTKPTGSYLPLGDGSPLRSPTSYLDAVSCLQKVRSRLVATDSLDDEGVESLNTLTLALQNGSDQE